MPVGILIVKCLCGFSYSLRMTGFQAFRPPTARERSRLWRPLVTLSDGLVPVFGCRERVRPTPCQTREPRTLKTSRYPEPLPPNVIVTGLSDIGRTRSRNEDSIALLPDLGAAVVADGMGGHPGGDVASRLAADTAASVLRDRIENLDASVDDRLGLLRETMLESVASAHLAIRQEARTEPELEGMGTTVTALLIDGKSDTYLIGHVGDSRAYRYRSGTLDQLTRDDTWVQDRVDAGEFTQEQADRHPFGHILTQCVGLEEPPTVHVYDGPVERGDVFLLCSDGLIGMLDDDRVAKIMHDMLGDMVTAEAVGAVAGALVAQANEAGGFDNITVSLLTAG